jgi:hypothetical protein
MSIGRLVRLGRGLFWLAGVYKSASNPVVTVLKTFLCFAKFIFKEGARKKNE